MAGQACIKASDSSFAATFPDPNASLSFQVDTAGAKSFVTGGGTIPSPPLTGPGKATFGFVAGYNQNGSLFGHLVYIDHFTGFTVHSTSIDQFATFCLCVGGLFASFNGRGESSAGPVEFFVDVSEGAEGETFLIEVINTETLDYNNAGPVSGEFQAHSIPICPPFPCG